MGRVSDLRTVTPPTKRGKNFKKHKPDKPELDAAIADHNQSVFERKLRGIRKFNKKHDYGEQAMVKMYKGLLDMVLSLIPIAEQNYRKFKIDKNVYALNVLANQAREVANDMRSVADFTNQAEQIVQMARRQFTLIASALVDEAYRLKREIKSSTSAKHSALIDEKLDALVRGHGKYLNESSKALSQAILEYMTERHTPSKRQS